MTEHRVLENDRFQLVSTSSKALTLFARVVVRYDNGVVRRFQMTRVTNASRIQQTRLFGLVELPGVVERAQVVSLEESKRGQCYVELSTKDDMSDEIQDLLCQDYIANGLQPSLNRFNESGPGGGTGFKQNSAIVSNATPVDIEHTLAATNALRRIDGFIWYYHANVEVATRTLRVSLRDLGNGLPTGMTSGAKTTVKSWPSAGVLTLTANEEGLIYVNAVEGKSFAVSLDDGAATIEDITTNPDPFPYWAQESEVGELFFDVESADFGDRHSIYVIREEWIYI